MNRLWLLALGTGFLGCSGGGESRQPPARAPSVAESASGAPNAPKSDVEGPVRKMAAVKGAWGASFSPDGKRVAFISDRDGVPELYVVPLEGGEPQKLVASTDPISAPSWSPDGEWLAFQVAPGGGMNAQIHLVRSTGRDRHMVTDGGKETTDLGPWSHDGKNFAFASNRRNPADTDLYLFDIATGKSRLLSQNRGRATVQDISRDGKKALIRRAPLRGNSNVHLVTAATGTDVLLTPHEGPGSFSGKFSEDARTVYLISDKDRDRTAFAALSFGPNGNPQAIKRPKRGVQTPKPCEICSPSCSMFQTAHGAWSRPLICVRKAHVRMLHPERRNHDRA